jgi:FlaA1/EpsC-like NDP-sugar epimerase
MGEPVRIRDLAEQLIRFHGYEPETEIKIEYIGLRSGERMDETLLSKDEMPSLTDYSRILRINKKNPQSIDISSLLNNLRPICKFDSYNPKAYRNIELLHSVLKEQLAVE